MCRDTEKPKTQNLKLKLLMPGPVLQEKWGNDTLLCRAVYSYLAYRHLVGASQREIAKEMCLGRRSVKRAVELLGSLVKTTGKGTSSRYWAEPPNDGDFVPAHVPNAKHWRDAIAYLYVELIPEIGLLASVYKAATEVLGKKGYQTDKGIAKYIGCHPTSIKGLAARAAKATKQSTTTKGGSSLYQRCFADCGSHDYVTDQIGHLLGRYCKAKGKALAEAEIIAKRAEHDANMKTAKGVKKNNFLAFLKTYLQWELEKVPQSTAAIRTEKIKPSLHLVLREFKESERFLFEKMAELRRPPTQVELVTWVGSTKVSGYYLVATGLRSENEHLKSELGLSRESWDLLSDAERSQILGDRSQILASFDSWSRNLYERSQIQTNTKDNTNLKTDNKELLSATPNKVASLVGGRAQSPTFSASELQDLEQFLAPMLE